MTLPKDRKAENSRHGVNSQPVEDFDIRSIHPDKMEEWAEHLVRKLKNEY